MEKEFICIVCPRGCHIHVDENQNITGYSCPRGLNYVKQELLDPRRCLTSTFKVKNSINLVCPCKTSQNVPKGKMKEIVDEISKVEIEAPISMHQVIIKNVLDLGIDIIATKEIK